MFTADFNQLKKNLKKDFSNFPQYKIAVLGEASTQHFVMALKGSGLYSNQNLIVQEGDIDQLDIQIKSPDSELYEFAPEFVILLPSVKVFSKRFSSLDLFNKREEANDRLAYYSELISILTAKGIKVIFANYPEYNDNVFGNYSNKTDLSLVYQLRKFNYELMNYAMKQNGLYIIDINSLFHRQGWNNSFNPALYVNSDIIYNLDILPSIANNITSIINSIKGKFLKCIVLDLDNTLWGGIIGDDGIEKIEIGDYGIGKAFSEFQKWLLSLKQRGIILCVCSKNDEDKAKDPFLNHPDMILRLDDISVFVANWNSKAENIKYIQQVLNIGFDSIAFFDDNIFERNLVKTMLPLVVVPDLPEDPVEYLDYLIQSNLFETASFSNEDVERTLQYKQEADRNVVKMNYSDENEYLDSLEMYCDCEPLTKFNIPRVAQLSQRSNQFNLRTIRYTENELFNMMNDSNYIPLVFSLKDKFGDYGTIAVVILRIQENNLFIENWFMSCRVLKRGMENFTLNKIVESAQNKSIQSVIGEYIATVKNTMVENHYKQLDFEYKNEYWNTNVDSYLRKNTTIKEKRLSNS